ncbi:MAG TPA: polysaccharide deacetylase family protein [Niabella sp.]|nr:polysaccharide deacetylase family protein [Niabella sp.]
MGEKYFLSLLHALPLVIMYLVKTPFWLKRIYHNYHWDFTKKDKKLYLTFDDGPHPKVTTFVLEQLKRFDAKATFFCVGENVSLFPETFKQITDQGHAIGNHTYNHLNGWKTDTEVYLHNINKASTFISSSLFRPPYGRIRKEQGKALMSKGYQIIMWDVLSADFDQKLSPEKCLQNVIKNAVSGSIIVFHDSEKAFKNLYFALPKVLDYFSQKGFSFDAVKAVP